MNERLKFSSLPPEPVQAMLRIEKHLATSVLSTPLLELVRMRVSQINGCAYCLDMHHKEAVHAGVSLLKLYTLPAWRESLAYDGDERIALAVAESLTRIASNDPEPALLDRALEHFGESGFADLCLAISQINSWNQLATACRFPSGHYQLAADARPSAAAGRAAVS